VDSLFRTQPEGENTAIAGSSLGGVASLFMAYRYPDVFSKALIFSPSLWFSDSLRQYCLAQNQPVTSRLYWVCGTNEGDPDMVPDMNQCYQDLQNAGMPQSQMKKLVVTGGTHSEGFWSQQVKAGISWLFTPTTGSKKKEGSDPFLNVYRKGNRLELQADPQEKPLNVEFFDRLGRQVAEPVSFSNSFSIKGLSNEFLVLKISTEKGVQILKVPPGWD